MASPSAPSAAHQQQQEEFTGASSVTVTDVGRLQRRLEQWLAERLGVGAVAISGMDRPVGAGRSNDTFLFAANFKRDGGAERRDLVLRIKPDQFQIFMDTNFREQFQILEALHSSSQARVAAPCWYEEDGSILGRAFYVMERLRGRVPVSYPPYNSAGWLFDAVPRERERLWLSAMGEMARLHRTPIDLLGFLRQPHRGATGFQQHWTYAVQSWRWASGGAVVPFIEDTIAWLESNVPAAPRDGLSWGDARIGNMMFDDHFCVAGVMDWEQLSLGGALNDLAWWLAVDDAHSVGMGLKRLEGLGNRQQTIDTWEALTGQSAADLHWYEVFTGFKLATILHRMFDLIGNARPGENARNNNATRRIAALRGVTPPSDPA